MNFTLEDTWEDRYRYVIQLGSHLPKLLASDRIEANKVSGCVSQVWILCDKSKIKNETILTFRGESDAMIVQGMLAVAISIYSGLTVSKILDINGIELIEKIGLGNHLTAQRANGVISIINKMKVFANAYSTDL